MTIWRKIGLGILPLLLSVPAFAHPPVARPELSSFDPPESIPQISVEKSGAIPTKPGMCLRLNADPGDVHVFTDESSQVTYHVVVQVDSRFPGAAEFLRQFNLDCAARGRGRFAGRAVAVAGFSRTIRGEF